jgi:hypothetical protein
MSWWLILLIALGSAAVGSFVTYVLTLLWIGKGMNWLWPQQTLSVFRSRSIFLAGSL